LLLNACGAIDFCQAVVNVAFFGDERVVAFIEYTSVVVWQPLFNRRNVYQQDAFFAFKWVKYWITANEMEMFDGA
jgi:hypothetical protein